MNGIGGGNVGGSVAFRLKRISSVMSHNNHTVCIIITIIFLSHKFD